MEHIFVVQDSNLQEKIVAVYQDLDNAIFLCSKRHHFIQHKVWINAGNENVFEDYEIFQVSLNIFPCVKSKVEFEFLPLDEFTQDIIKEKSIKEKVMERAEMAKSSLDMIEKQYTLQRGLFWRFTLTDDEMKNLITLEDTCLDEVMYEKWGSDPGNPFY